MRSILTVTQAASSRDLTTLDRVLAELGLTAGTASVDDLLDDMIVEKSAVAASFCNRVFGVETLSERFWTSDAEVIQLRRWPVVEIDSVTADGIALAADVDYLLDADTGQLMRIASTYPSRWYAGAVVVEYSAGYNLPGETDRNLPEDIEAAVVALVKAAWRSRARDPNLKEVDVVGVAREVYWVDGSSASSLPPEVENALEPWRMPSV